MAKDRQKHLFLDGDLSGSLAKHEQDVLAKVAALSDKWVREAAEETIAREIFDEDRVQQIVLHEGDVQKVVNETQVDVRHDTFRHIRDRSRPTFVSGYQFVCKYPYSGDSILWKLKPSSWSSVFPSGEVEALPGGRDGFLTLSVTVAGEADPSQLKASVERELETIRKYLGWQLKQIEEFNSGLERKIFEAVKQRAGRLKSAASLAEALGASPGASPFPSSGTSPATSARADLKSTSRKVSAHDVFVSHASEDKVDLVRPLAELLRREGLSVWVDETELKLGDSLRRSIDKGLASCRFGIVVLSPNFFSKSWPQYELDGLVAREINGQKVILPVWHKVNRDDVLKFSPSLADKLAASTQTKSIEEICAEIVSAVR